MTLSGNILWGNAPAGLRKREEENQTRFLTQGGEGPLETEEHENARKHDDQIAKRGPCLEKRRKQKTHMTIGWS